MATTTLNTRIQLKCDTYSNWQTIADSFVPLSGELCIVIVPPESGAAVQEPTILFKVGDGTKTFGQLLFVSGLAADVYDWAKAKAKPEYTANEISGLSDYISGKVDDSDTQYKLEQDADDEHILKLYSKPLNGEWTVQATITTPDTIYDDTALKGRVTSLETLVGSDSVATQIAAAITTITEDTTTIKTRVTANEKAIATLTGTGDGSVSKAVADAMAAIVADAPESFDTLKEISNWITEHTDSATAMNTQINANKADIAALTMLIGKLPEGAESETVIAYIAELINGSVPKGALASKDKVAEIDLEDALAAKINGKTDDADLAAVAKSGNVKDLTQTEGDYIIFNCGSATTVI